MKKLLLIAFFLPSICLANTAVSWSTPTTTNPFGSPNPINGVSPGIIVSASSTIDDQNGDISILGDTNGYGVWGTGSQAGVHGEFNTNGSGIVFGELGDSANDLSGVFGQDNDTVDQGYGVSASFNGGISTGSVLQAAGIFDYLDSQSNLVEGVIGDNPSGTGSLSGDNAFDAVGGNIALDDDIDNSINVWNGNNFQNILDGQWNGSGIVLYNGKSLDLSSNTVQNNDDLTFSVTNDGSGHQTSEMGIGYLGLNIHDNDVGTPYMTIQGSSGGTPGAVTINELGTGCVGSVSGQLTNTKCQNPSFNQWTQTNASTITPTSTAVGILVDASSTIGNGTVGGGLIIFGGATTTQPIQETGTTGLNNFSAGIQGTTISGTTITSNGTYRVNTNGSHLIGPTNGTFEMSNSAVTDFTALQFGGTTNQFPELSISTSTAKGISIKIIGADGAGNADLIVSGKATSTTMNLVGNNTNGISTLFTIASSSVAQVLYSEDQQGDIIASGTPPVLSSCGTSPSVVGNNQEGEITVGSVAATGCTATFRYSYPTARYCSISNQSMSVVNALTYTVSVNSLVLSQTGLTGDKIDYQCSGY